jgi:Tol biopolymer transport system component
VGGRSRHVLTALLLCACKAELDSGAVPADATLPDGGSSVVIRDAAPDAPLVLGPWGTAAAIPGASSTTLSEDDATLSSSKLELYFKSNASGATDLFVMTRATPTSAWSAPSLLTTLSSSVVEESPRLSPDDKTMYFGRNGDIYMTTRTAVGQPWGAPTPVTALNTGAYEKWADVCDGGYAIVSRDAGNNNQELYAGTVTGGATTALTLLNSTTQDQGTLLTADCLGLYFQSNRSGTFDIYLATRATTAAAWSAPTALPDFNTTTANEEDPWISTDQRVFVFASDVNGTKDLFIATR